MDPLARAAASFRRFADVECGASPLYRRIALAVAEAPELLELAAAAPGGQPLPNLFLGAVHYLLLENPDQPLARYYPSLTPVGAREGDPFPAFRSFALEHAEAIRSVLAVRLVQTNEVARAACLLPAFAEITRRCPDRPLDLVEVGSSAGLLLLWDQYRYRFSDGRTWGPADSPLTLTCELRGEARPPLPRQPVQVSRRVGLDLNPLNPAAPADARWLRALVWPDQPWRDARLLGALAVAARRPVELVAGNALETLPAVLARASADSLRCVFHCHTLNQFTAETRQRFAAILAENSRLQGEVHQVALEYAPGAEWPEITWTRYADGATAEQLRLARYQAHGEWLEWLS